MSTGSVADDLLAAIALRPPAGHWVLAGSTDVGRRDGMRGEFLIAHNPQHPASILVLFVKVSALFPSFGRGDVETLEGYNRRIWGYVTGHAGVVVSGRSVDADGANRDALRHVVAQLYQAAARPSPRLPPLTWDAAPFCVQCESRTTTKVCARCNKVRYCNAVCQRANGRATGRFATRCGTETGRPCRCRPSVQ